MLNAKRIKRELLESVTFSMDEAALVIGVSSSHIKNACAGRNPCLKLKGMEMSDFTLEDLPGYKEQEVDFVKDQRGSYPNYRIFFHGVERIIKTQQGTLKSKEDYLEFVRKEKEKLELRQKLLQEMENKYNQLLTAEKVVSNG